MTSEDTITVPREHYERLKNERVVLFGANNGKWTDEELESNAVQAALEAAGRVIETGRLTQRPIASFTPDQFREMIQQATWAYMQIYVDYIPF